MLGLELSSSVDAVVDNIGNLPLDLFAETLQEILSHLQEQRGLDVMETCDKFQRSGINLDQQVVQDIIKLMIFQFRVAAKSNLSADDLISKLNVSCTKWSKAALKLVHRLWTEHGAVIHAHQEMLSMDSIGQLVDMQWKLGMAVSSDSCRSLNSPFISVLLKYMDTSGEMKYKSFEMTVQQFQNFHRQFKEIASVLETV